MNVELTIAVDQLRRRSTDRAWFIPVLFDGGEVPDRPVGGGETLRDIQWVDLTTHWAEGMKRILGLIDPSREQLAPPEAQVRVILMTDLIGATPMLETVGAHNFVGILSQVYTQMSTIVSKNDGVLISFIGDGMLAAFEKGANAIRAAFAIQDWLDGVNGLSEFGTRMGLAAGAVIRSEGSFLGDTVNIASRVCSVAAAGQIVAADSVLALGLDDGIEARALQLPVLKGALERIGVYQLRRV
jgi:class 3 adenylate cyclase